MTQPKDQTTDELIAELNARLRARDPMHVMKQQIRVRTLGEVRLRVRGQRLTDETHAEVYDRVETIIEELEQPLLA